MKSDANNQQTLNAQIIKTSVALLILLTAITKSGCTVPERSSVEQQSSVPRNIIFFIADGCGYNHVDAASYYTYGQTGMQLYEQFPVRYGMSTYPIDGHGYDPDSAWATFDYHKKKTTDSAASATAMSTGVKTYNGAICVDSDKKPLESIIDRVEKLGKATGVVSSVTFAHATPASFVTNNISRNNYQDIARAMILESPVEVIMGCGHPEFNVDAKKAEEAIYKYVGDKETWNALKSGKAGADSDGDGQPDPWTLIEDRAEFKKLKNGKTPMRVIGIPKVFDTLQKKRLGDEYAEPYAVPFNESVPTLSEMTLAALNILDNDADGFFLMVEGGAVDWASHDNQSGRMIEEKIDFDNAIIAAITWLESHSDWGETLMIITGDHETGYLYGPGSNPKTDGAVLTREEIWKPLVNNGKLKQPDMVWNSGGHTNTLIPFYAKGAGSHEFHAHADNEDPVRGRYLDNADIGKVLLSFYE